MCNTHRPLVQRVTALKAGILFHALAVDGVTTPFQPVTEIVRLGDYLLVPNVGTPCSLIVKTVAMPQRNVRIRNGDIKSRVDNFVTNGLGLLDDDVREFVKVQDLDYTFSEAWGDLYGTEVRQDPDPATEEDQPDRTDA